MRMLVLGQDGVGKSAFIVRYLTKRFIGEYDPTLEGIFKKDKIINNQKVSIEMKDTAKGINWPKRANDLIWTDALIFIYSITNRSSFFEIQKISKIIEQQKKTRGIPCLIVGNKQELSHLRAVSVLEGAKLASNVNGRFCELSVAETFTEIADVVDQLVIDHCHCFKFPPVQVKILSSKSSPDIRKKTRDLRPVSQPDMKKVYDQDDNKSERKGRALWQKLRANNHDVKKHKK